MFIHLQSFWSSEIKLLQNSIKYNNALCKIWSTEFIFKHSIEIIFCIQSKDIKPSDCMFLVMNIPMKLEEIVTV